MGFYLQGLKLADGPILSRFEDKTSVNVDVHSIYGSDSVEVEIVSIDKKEFSIEVPLSKDNLTTMEQVEYIANNLKGLVHRLTPLHLLSEEVPLWGNFHEVFLAVTSVDVDWQAGTGTDNLWASVALKGVVLGPPKTLTARYAVKSTTRDGDFYTDLAGRSTVAIPYFDPAFLTRVNQDILEVRNGTTMLDLSDAGNGFANDTVTTDAYETLIGAVSFRLDTDNLNFLANGIQVYDEGYTPRKRIYAKVHDFSGDLAIETELYRIVIDTANSEIDLFASTGTIGAYEGTAFLTVLPSTQFVEAQLIINQDEIVRVKLDTADYVEIERGKDPVFEFQDPDDGFDYSGVAALGAIDTTTTGVNYILLGDDVYVTSNFDFQVGTAQDVRSTVSNQEQVYGIMHGANVIADGRHREILKKIS